MRKITILFSSCFILFAASFVYGQVVVNEPDICFDCHGDIQKLTQKKHNHTAFSNGKCSDCHNPHAAKHALLLNEEIDVLCFSCHEDFAKKAEDKSHHNPVTQGDCTGCHNPHASDFNGQLNQTQTETCQKCHKPVVEWLASEYIHPPVGDNCLSCHNAHRSENNKLLSDNIPALCFSCHDQSSAFLNKHQGFKIESTDCSACHDPHASSLPGLLRPNQHAPFKGGNCKACHDTTPNANYAVIAENKKLCLKCHRKTIDDQLLYTHNINDEKSCVNCHNPHTSSQTNLLSMDQATLCMKCHFNDVEGDKETYITHIGIDCSSCHSPHGANNSKYLNSTEIDLCKTCHEKAHTASHPIGKDIIDPRNGEEVTCLSCHKLHGSKFEKYLPLDPAMDLCIQCHKR